MSLHKLSHIFNNFTANERLPCGLTTFRRGRKNSFITLNLSVYGVLGGCTSFDSYVWNCAGLCIGQNILDIYALQKTVYQIWNGRGAWGSQVGPVVSGKK